MWGMLIGSAVSVLGGLMDSASQNDAYAAQETARRKQKLQMVRQANIQDANLMLQDKSNFEAARLELENQTMSAIKAQSTVRTAMAESNLEGRSMDRVMRDVENVHLRTKGQIQENYERDYHNIWVARASNRDQLIAGLEGSQPQQKPNGMGQLLGVATQGAQGAVVGQNLWGIATAE